jgi:hypothetical protein
MQFKRIHNKDLTGTLLALARRSFAEVSAAFPDSSGAEIVIDQDPGDYRVRVTFAANPASPTLWIERFPKPNLASFLIEPEREYTLSSRRDFGAFDGSSDGSQFGWLERSVSGPPLADADIIGIVHGLL